MRQLRRGKLGRMSAILGLAAVFTHVLLLSLHVAAASAGTHEASTLRAIALAICGPMRSSKATSTAGLTDDGNPAPSTPRYECPLCSGAAPSAVALPNETVLALIEPTAEPALAPTRVFVLSHPEIRAEKSRGPPLPVHA